MSVSEITDQVRRERERLTWIRPAYSVESFWTMGSICLHGPHLLNCIVKVAAGRLGEQGDERDEVV